MSTTVLPSAEELKGSPQPLQSTHSLASFKSFRSTPTIGTEFDGSFQLSSLLTAPNSDALIRDLGILVSERGVAFFRAQDLNIEDQKEITRRLGRLTGKPASSTLHAHPITEQTSELGAEISVISSDRQQDYRRSGERSKLSSREWHSDITFEPVPSDYAILKIHTFPEFDGEITGGDTLWASGYEVYDRLSPSFAAYLETLSAYHEGKFFHDVAKSLGNRLRDGIRGSPLNVGGALEATHPVVRVNPVTGWKSVYVNRAFTKRIVGVTKDESDFILQYLFALVDQNHDLQVRFRWEKDSVAIWDNRSTYHAATNDYDGQRRVGDRVVSIGEKPSFDPKGVSRRQALGLESSRGPTGEIISPK